MAKARSVTSLSPDVIRTVARQCLVARPVNEASHSPGPVDAHNQSTAPSPASTLLSPPPLVPSRGVAWCSKTAEDQTCVGELPRVRLGLPGRSLSPRPASVRGHSARLPQKSYGGAREATKKKLLRVAKEREGSAGFTAADRRADAQEIEAITNRLVQRGQARRENLEKYRIDAERQTYKFTPQILESKSIFKDDPLWQRADELAKERVENLKEKQKAAAEAEVAEFSYTPAISCHARRLERRDEDIEKWVKDRSEKIKKLGEALEKKELEECTFTPRILESAADHTETGSEAGRLRGSAGMRCTSRLHEDAGRRQESRGLTPPRARCDCVGCRGRAAAGWRSGGGFSFSLPGQRPQSADDGARFVSFVPSETGRGNLGARSPISFDQFMQRSKSSADARTVGRQRVVVREPFKATSPSPAGSHLTSRVRLTFAPSVDDLHLAETPRTPPLAASIASIPTKPPPPHLLHPPRSTARKGTIMSGRSRPTLARAASAKWDESSGPARRPAVQPGKNFIQYDPEFGDIFALPGLRT